jgi:uncharacterized membrane protein
VAIRLVAAAALLGLVLAVRRQSLAPLHGRWHHLAFAGALVNGITLSAFHVGMVTENVAVIALLQTLSPMLIAVSVAPLLGERLGPGQWLGLTLGAVGVILLVAPRAFEGPAAWGGCPARIRGRRQPRCRHGLLRPLRPRRAARSGDRGATRRCRDPDGGADNRVRAPARILDVPGHGLRLPADSSQ